MKKRVIEAGVWAALGCMILAVLCTCSKSDPIPRHPSLTERKMLQVRSEQDLARQLSEEIAKTIAEHPGLAGVPVYLRTSDDTLFLQRFANLLIAELTQRGVRVSSEQEDTLVLEFKVLDRVLVSVALLRDNYYLIQISRVFDTGPVEISEEAAIGVWERYALRRPASIR